MSVWTVTLTAVYDHGLGGVFSTREAAEACARSLADDSDGHHDIQVQEFRLDHETPHDVLPLWSGFSKTRRRTPRIEVNPLP